MGDVTLRILYTFLYLLLLPVIILRLYWRSLHAPAYRKRLSERFALVPKRHGDRALIWVHAVSVGEAIAATPMVRRLMKQYPAVDICITTTTPTGSERVRSAFGDKVLHYYLPYDVPLLFLIFIKALRPNLLVVMETELWPNMVATCVQHRLPVILANGRMSSGSARGYRRFAGLTRPMLQQLAAIAAQSAADAERFIALGADPERVTVTGSIKFDIDIDQTVFDRVVALRNQLDYRNRRLVIFASTHPGEDEQILPMVKRLHHLAPEFLALIVPRHPERFQPVYELCAAHKLNAVRISDGRPCTAETQVIIGDTMGDMLAFYGLSDVAFIGGSLLKHGGHNFLEAAAWGLPLLSGRYVFNFQSIADMLVNEHGLLLMRDHYELERTLQAWLKQPRCLAGIGVAARQVFEENQGALDKLLMLIQQQMD